MNAPLSRALLLALAGGLHLGACAQAAVGVHVASWHSRPGYQGFNPGVYARLDNGFTAGAYRNSMGHGSAYAGWTLSGAAHGPLQASLTLGGVAGYRACMVCPLAVPSARLALADGWALRVAWLPTLNREKQHASAVHVMLEYSPGPLGDP